MTKSHNSMDKEKHEEFDLNQSSLSTEIEKEPKELTTEMNEHTSVYEGNTSPEDSKMDKESTLAPESNEGPDLDSTMGLDSFKTMKQSPEGSTAKLMDVTNLDNNESTLM